MIYNRYPDEVVFGYVVSWAGRQGGLSWDGLGGADEQDEE